MFLVKWSGYHRNESTREPEYHLSTELINSYHLSWSKSHYHLSHAPPECCSTCLLSICIVIVANHYNMQYKYFVRQYVFKYFAMLSMLRIHLQRRQERFKLNVE